MYYVIALLVCSSLSIYQFACDYWRICSLEADSGLLLACKKCLLVWASGLKLLERKEKKEV